MNKKTIASSPGRGQLWIEFIDIFIIETVLRHWEDDSGVRVQSIANLTQKVVQWNKTTIKSTLTTCSIYRGLHEVNIYIDDDGTPIG